MTERETDFNRVDITIGIENREILSRKTVAVLGLGSEGSEVTRLLSMTGVGRFILIDPEKLEPENIVRHVCGLPDLGRYKVAAVKDYIQREKNPQAEIFSLVGYAEAQPELCAKSDLVILPAWGNPQDEQYLADELRKRNVPVLVTGVYGKGIGGEVFLVKPEEGPCYSCFLQYLGRKTAKLKEKPTVYGFDQNEAASVPALALDINRIATIAADFTVKTLLGEPFDTRSPSVNLVFFGNKEFTIGTGESDRFEPLSSRWDVVPQDKNCLICNPDSQEYLFDSSAVQGILKNFTKGGEQNE